MKRSYHILKYSLWAFVFVCFLPTENSFAQRPRRGFLPDSSQIMITVDTLAAKLSLTTEQKEKVCDIYFSTNEDLQKEFEKNRGDFRAMREVFQEMREKRTKKIKELLNKEQKKAYDQYLEEQEKLRRDRRGGRRRPPRF